MTASKRSRVAVSRLSASSFSRAASRRTSRRIGSCSFISARSSSTAAISRSGRAGLVSVSSP